MKDALESLRTKSGTAFRIRVQSVAETPQNTEPASCPSDVESLFEEDSRNGEITKPPLGAVIFPGSFNPPHRGHERMAKIAAMRLGKPVDWEISVANVDKPTLSADELQPRLNQLARLSLTPKVPTVTIWITLAATFAEKADIFKGATFIVGADTIRRIADVRYYDDDPRKMSASIRRLVEDGSRFLVFGRFDLAPQSQVKEFQSLDGIALPDELRAICDSVDESEFREDIASRDLR